MPVIGFPDITEAGKAAQLLLDGGASAGQVNGH